MATANGLDVEVVVADHQGKAGVGVRIARQWFDRDGVDVAMDFQNSAITSAIAGFAKEKDKVALVCNSGTTALTKAGGDTWFFITADYAFGHALQGDTTRFVQQAGGKILGNVNMPFPTADFYPPFCGRNRPARRSSVSPTPATTR